MKNATRVAVLYPIVVLLLVAAMVCRNAAFYVR